jgi:signal transduction protein with GAF and PtsI domain
MSDMERILDRIAAGSLAESAVKEVLRDDYGDLMKSTAEYLKKSYGR